MLLRKSVYAYISVIVFFNHLEECLGARTGGGILCWDSFYYLLLLFLLLLLFCPHLLPQHVLLSKNNVKSWRTTKLSQF